MEDCENLHKKSMDKNVDKRDVYNIWAKTYDKYVKSLNYTGPKEIVDKLIKYLENTNGKQNILDFGCGTGLIGEELNNYSKCLPYFIHKKILTVNPNKNPAIH